MRFEWPGSVAHRQVSGRRCPAGFNGGAGGETFQAVAVIGADARERIAYLARKHRVAVYWLYLRSANSPGLMLESGEAPENADAVPEYALHRFFASMGTAYQAYEASDGEALKKAIEAVNRLENLPITYVDTVPRRDLSAACYGVALACVMLLLVANLAEIQRWH